MDSYEINEQELLTALLGAIRALPDACAEITQRELPISVNRRADAIIDMGIAGHEMQLVVEARREAYPRDIRELLWQLRNYLAHLSTPDQKAIPFIAARSISRGARDLLREEGVGFFDLGGSLFIPGRAIYVLVDRPPPKRTRRVVSVFEGRKARTMMTLFSHRDEWVGVTELAALAGVSPATASATLSEMERHDWVEAQGSGPSKARRLRNPKALVDEWAAYVVQRKPPKAERFYVPCPDADALCRKLDHASKSNDLLYALTAEAAAQHYAPYLSTISQVRCRMAPGPLRDRVLQELDARRVSEGWNLALLDTKSTNDIIVGDEIGGISLAPPLQVYLDLLQVSGRAKEMAAHLRQERLVA